MTYELSSSAENAIVVKAYRTLIKGGCNHSVAINKIRLEVISRFPMNLSKDAGLQIAEYLERESNLAKWWN